MAPFYDYFLSKLMQKSRGRSIESLHLKPESRILICGAGTGLDLPHLPANSRVFGSDITLAMILRARAKKHSPGLRLTLQLADAESLPFREASFDAVILHLILAVVPDARRAFQEAVRVARPEAHITVFDKFLRPNEKPSLARRAANRVTRRLGTGLNLRIEDVIRGQDDIRTVSDEGDLLGGLFRRILFVKAHPDRSVVARFGRE